MIYLVSFAFQDIETGLSGEGCTQVETLWFLKLSPKHLDVLRKRLAKEIKCDEDHIVFLGIYKF